MKKEIKKILLFSSLVWTISNFHHPVTPTYYTGLNLPDHIFGTSYAAMVFAMFITSPIWGSIGDKGKRKLTLILSTFFYGIIQIGFSFVTSLWSILILRVFAGVAAGGFHVGLMSALVDISPKDNRKIIMTNYAATLSVFSAMGFLIGGLLGCFTAQTVFIIQGISMIFVALGIKIFLQETNIQEKGSTKKTKFIWDIVSEARKNKETFNSWTIIFLLITFFISLAYSGNNNAFNYYLKAELNMKPVVNGIWKAAIGIIGLVANLSVNVWIINKTNIKRSMTIVIFLNVVFAYLLFWNNNIISFFSYSFLFFTLYIIELPMLQGFAVENKTEDVGFMAGIFNAIKSLGEMLGAIIAGFSYNFDSKMPFLIAAISISLAFILSFVNYLKSEREVVKL